MTTKCPIAVPRTRYTPPREGPQMPTGFRALVVSATFAVALSVLPGSAQAPYRAPRSADGKANLNGIWQAMNEANWDIEGHSAAPGRVLPLGAEDAEVPGLGVVEGG